MSAAGRVFDPFAMPAHQGLEPTQALAWDRIAAKIVRDVLQLAPHERVIVSADPYFGGAALDAVRQEVQRARAIELATILHWTPTVSALRQANGRAVDADLDRAEKLAMQDLFSVADVFILLMNDRRGRRTVANSQSDEVVEGWPRGRSVHLHWFHDPAIPDPAHPVNLALDRMNQAAVIDLDYAALESRMRSLAAQIAGKVVHVTDSAGTDLRFRAGPHLHVNYGDASREHMATMTSGRDREEEIPAGSLRTIPEEGTAEGVIVFPVRKDGESPALGRGFDCAPFARAGLRFVFRGGRAVRVETDGDQAALDALWANETGDKDRLGELVLGCNPVLQPVPGSTFMPHYGFGAGVLRLILGDNSLSGGAYRSSLHRWLMWPDASIEAGGKPIVDRGRLLD